MMFGEHLRLPGEFFVSSDGDMAEDPAFVADLRQKIRSAAADTSCVARR